MERLKRREPQVVRLDTTTQGGYLFDVSVNGEVIVTGSTIPLLDAARELSRRGYDDAAIIEMYCPGKSEWSLRSRVGPARKLVVGTSNAGRPVLAKYRDSRGSEV